MEPPHTSTPGPHTLEMFGILCKRNKTLKRRNQRCVFVRIQKGFAPLSNPSKRIRPTKHLPFYCHLAGWLTGWWSSSVLETHSQPVPCHDILVAPSACHHGRGSAATIVADIRGGHRILHDQRMADLVHGRLGRGVVASHGPTASAARPWTGHGADAVGNRSSPAVRELHDGIAVLADALGRRTG